MIKPVNILHVDLTESQKIKQFLPALGVPYNPAYYADLLEANGSRGRGVSSPAI